MIAQALERHGERALLRDARGVVSGHQALAAVQTAAKRLSALGLREHEVVAIIPGLSRECVLALLALWHRGCAALVLADREPDARLRKLIAERGCRLSLSPRPLRTDGAELGFAALFDGQATGTLPAREPTLLPGAATVLATSGSTGEPKLVVHGLDAHLASARGAVDALQFGEDDTWLLNLPLYHVGGLAPVFRALASGGALSLPDADVQPSHVSVVAAQLARALGDEEVTRGLARCQTVLAGGGPIPIALRRRALDAGIPLVMSYGSTETASLITAERDTQHLVEFNSAGRALPGRSLATSTDGEVLVRGDTLLSGYLTGDGLSDPRDDEGWLATGDLGHLDASGRLFVSGRADRMFVSGGENVYPDEIERALLDHDSLTDAVVIAVPHAEYGERPVAFVGTEGDTSGEDLARFLAEQLPGYKIPDAFFRLPPNTSAEALRRIGNDPDSFGSLRC